MLDNYVLFDYCQIREGSQNNDSSLESYSKLISSISEKISADISISSEYSYSLLSSIINSTFISSSILTSDSLSYSENILTTDFSSIYIYSSNLPNNTNISNFSDISNFIDITNYTNSSMIIGKEILENKKHIDKDEIIDNIPEIINSIDSRETYEIKGDDYTLIIRPINASHLSNSTYINFKKCEDLLRYTLNISSSRIITFLQMEINNNNENSLVNKVEYQVYDDNKTLLDLSICKDIDIEISYAMKDNSLDMNSISEFKDKGIDIFNIDDSFFNDICHPYSDSNNDIVLEDRIKDIYQNYSLCDDGCTYNGLDLINKTISCDCKVKTNISINESSLILKQFNEIKIESNFGLIKCYELVFSFNGKSKNIGFWIFLILVLAHIPLLLIYFCKGIKSIEKYIINQMEEYGYINHENNK